MKIKKDMLNKLANISSPSWYSTRFTTVDDLEEYLENSEVVSYLGEYLKEEKIFRDGVYIKDDGDYKTLPAKINFIGKEKGYFLYRVIIVEGKKRQIKKMFAFFGIKVIELKRVRIGPIKLGKLEVGKYRELTDYEVDRLKESVGLV